MPEKRKIAKIKSEYRNRVTAPSDNESDDEIGYQGLTPAEILSSTHRTVIQTFQISQSKTLKWTWKKMNKNLPKN